MFNRAAVIFAFALATPAFAQTVTLVPADPQPSAGDLQTGLAVSYAYPSDVRTIDDATKALKRAKPGSALRGFSYDDNKDGELTLTSRQATKVAAAISGFIRFDAAGTFEVEFISNDGIAATIGGQQVAFFDDIHACEPAGATTVKVPQAGWYTVEATYFQRKGTACLMMDWTAGGEFDPVPDSAFAHLR